MELEVEVGLRGGIDLLVAATDMVAIEIISNAEFGSKRQARRKADARQEPITDAMTIKLREIIGIKWPSLIAIHATIVTIGMKIAKSTLQPEPTVLIREALA